MAGGQGEDMSWLNEPLPEWVGNNIAGMYHLGCWDEDRGAEQMRAVHMALIHYYGQWNWIAARDRRSRYGN